jgi:riboflavin synthase
MWANIVLFALFSAYFADIDAFRTRITSSAKRHALICDMFSGIVEEMGVVENLNKVQKMEMWDGSFCEGVELTVIADKALGDSYIGCSIAINGVCLTATGLDIPNNKLTVGLAPETLRRTNLGTLAKGGKVNLERALRADGRNSGHFVQGHVDGTGEIIEKWKEGDSLWVKVKVDDDIMKYIVPKGFIAIDGTSLTICETSNTPNNCWFTFMLIAHTQQCVIIPNKETGEFVNIEVDVLAKMVEQSMAGFKEGSTDELKSEINDLKGKIEKLEQLIK